MADEPLAKKRGLRPRYHGVAISGDGRFQSRGSFKWHTIPPGGARVVPGSLVRSSDSGTVRIGNERIGPGTLAQVADRQYPSRRQKPE